MKKRKRFYSPLVVTSRFLVVSVTRSAPSKTWCSRRLCSSLCHVGSVLCHQNNGAKDLFLFPFTSAYSWVAYLLARFANTYACTK